jgi:hypothetical protein
MCFSVPYKYRFASDSKIPCINRYLIIPKLLSENNSISISMLEVEEALRELEIDGIGQFIDKTNTFIVRSG